MIKSLLLAAIVSHAALPTVNSETPEIQHPQYIANSTEVIFKSVIIFQIYADDVGYQRVLAGCNTSSYSLIDISTEIIEATPYTEMEQAIYSACTEAQQWI